MTTIIQNEAPAHRYFTMMLNMADDDLDPFEYRLLAHYVRVCGSGETCQESVRTTAKITRMSTYKLQIARDSLVTKGYLEVVKPVKALAIRGETCKVKIVNRWSENISRYDKAVSNLTQPASTPVSNSTQVVPKPVSNLTQPLAQAVSNLTHSLDIEEKRVERGPARVENAVTVDGLLIAFRRASGTTAIRNARNLEVAEKLIAGGATVEQLERCVKTKLKGRTTAYLFSYLDPDFFDWQAIDRKKNRTSAEQFAAWGLEPPKDEDFMWDLDECLHRFTGKKAAAS